MSAEWRAVPSVLGMLASSEGEIMFQHRIFRQYRQKKQGYLSVIFSIGRGELRTVRVHRLVAEAFHGPCPEGRCVNHIDFNKENNRPVNLEYVTQRENMWHSVGAGRVAFGKPRKLSMADAVAIRELRSQGRLLREIGASFGVSEGLISRICSGRTWA